jgi:hypothetical protein
MIRPRHNLGPLSGEEDSSLRSVNGPYRKQFLKGCGVLLVKPARRGSLAEDNRIPRLNLDRFGWPTVTPSEAYPRVARFAAT